MIRLDADGYVRLRLDEFGAVQMIHLVSGLMDDGEEVALANSDTSSSIDGYTEWVSASTPVISLGWDWKLDPLEATTPLVRLESPRSNVMLIDRSGYDIGPLNTAVLLETVVDDIHWQSAVFSAIAQRYAA